MQDWKAFYRMTAWNWSMVQKQVLLVCTTMVVAQLAAQLVTAAGKQYLKMPYDVLYLGSYSWLILAVAYLAAMAVSLRPALTANGNSKTAYTVLTLPVQRSTIVLSQIACTALALCSIIVAQLLAVFLFYWPVMAVSHMAQNSASLQFVMQNGQIIAPGAAQSGFALAMVRHVALRIFLPTTLEGLVILAEVLLCSAVLLPCVLFHKAGARFGAIAMGLAGAVGCLGLLFDRVLVLEVGIAHLAQSAAVLMNIEQTALKTLCPMGLLGLCVAAYCWAVHDAKAAKYL